jgi:hypothetical protein
MVDQWLRLDRVVWPVCGYAVMVRSPKVGRKSPLFNKPAGREYEPPAREFEPEPNFDLLDEETKDELRKKAAARVEAAERDRAMEAFLEAETKRIEKELHPEAHEEEKEVEIDVALYADRIILDGKHYMHGRKYTVKKSRFDALQDIMWRTKKHYEATHRDPMKAMQEAAQAIAKGGPSYATINGSTGQVMKF